MKQRSSLHEIEDMDCRGQLDPYAPARASVETILRLSIDDSSRHLAEVSVTDVSPVVKQELMRAGWEHLRSGKGDHAVWWNPKSGGKVTVDSKIKSRHTANGILKRAGIEKKF